MGDLENKSNNIKLNSININMSDTTFPQLITQLNGNIKHVPWGKNNKMPLELFDYYTKCSEHHSIIDTRVNMMVGNGVEQDGTYSERTQKFIDNPNPYEDMSTLIKKLSYDFEIYGLAYIEIIYSADRKSISRIEHMDASKVRWGKKVSGKLIDCYYSDDWFKHSCEKVQIPVFNPLIKEDYPRQILPIIRYTPSVDYYTLPSYYSGIKWISIDYEISRFHEQNIKCGFTPSIYFGFPNGTPTEEEMEAIEDGLESQLAGQGGSFVTAYHEPGSDNRPEVQILQQSDIDNQYEWLSKHTQTEILIAHQVTSENIVGISTAGKLGGTNEMLEAYNIYFNSVVKHEQDIILKSINRILSENGMNDIIIDSNAPYYVDEEVEEVVEEDETLQKMSKVELKIKNSGLPILYKKGEIITHDGEDYEINEDVIDTSMLNFGSVIKASDGKYYELSQDVIDGTTGIKEDANITDMYVWTLGKGGKSRDNCPSCIKYSGKIRTLNKWMSTAIPGTSFASINSFNKKNPNWAFGTFCEANCSCKLIKIN